ncbi:hypothetical protein Bbelb_166180 [Branchiostoma belcheri]|nr:hypothetical protein Bbelb_166180 [Branchiostoma belcheri]
MPPSHQVEFSPLSACRSAIFPDWGDGRLKGSGFRRVCFTSVDGSTRNKQLPSAAYMERYRILEELGQGAFGKVYKAERKEDGGTLALKCLTVDSLDEGQVVMREIRALQQAVGKHPNILQYISVIAEDIGLNTPVLTVCLVVEYCNGDTLDSFILKDKPSRATVLQLLCDTAEGVAYLHGRNVVHGALKPDNIMVDNSGQRPVVKIADFGLVRVRELGQCGDINTYFEAMIMYRSPELLLNMLAQRELVTNTTMADVFALGLIIAAILGQTTDSAAPDPASPASDPATRTTDPADPATDPAAPGKLVPAVYVDGKRLAVAGAMIRYPEFPVADMLMTSEPQGSPVKALVVSMLAVYPHQRPTSEQVLRSLKRITGVSDGCCRCDSDRYKWYDCEGKGLCCQILLCLMWLVGCALVVALCVFKGKVIYPDCAENNQQRR